jgi:metal-responsive CopG/Arc/MetJ family transcriptional regulator
MKLNISMDDELLMRLDATAKDSYMSRSGLIAYACAQYLNQQEALRAIRDLALIMRTISDKGMVDDDAKEQLQDIETLLKMIAPTK